VVLVNPTGSTWRMEAMTGDARAEVVGGCDDAFVTSGDVTRVMRVGDELAMDVWCARLWPGYTLTTGMVTQFHKCPRRLVRAVTMSTPPADEGLTTPRG
jgi:hypothetical protein